MNDIPAQKGTADFNTDHLKQAKLAPRPSLPAPHVRDYITDMLGQLYNMARDNNLEDVSSLIDVTHKAMLYSDPNRLG